MMKWVGKYNEVGGIVQECLRGWVGSVKSEKLGETGLECSREWVGSVKIEEVGKD